MKIVLIILIIALCQTVFAEGNGNDGNMNVMMDQLKQLQGPAAAKPGAPAREEESTGDWQSATQASKSPQGLTEQRKTELAEYACKGQSHGVPCSFSNGDGTRSSGVCYKSNRTKGLYCKPSNYPKPTPPQNAMPTMPTPPMNGPSGK